MHGSKEAPTQMARSVLHAAARLSELVRLCPTAVWQEEETQVASPTIICTFVAVERVARSAAQLAAAGPARADMPWQRSKAPPFTHLMGLDQEHVAALIDGFADALASMIATRPASHDEAPSLGVEARLGELTVLLDHLEFAANRLARQIAVQEGGDFRATAPG